MFITVKKKNILSTIIVVALVLASYLSFKTPFEKQVVDATTDSSGQMVETGEAIMVSTNVSTIIEAKNNREIVRSKACELLTETVKDGNISSDAKQKAENMLLDMAEAIDCENECESLLEAKGFGECVVFVSDDSVNVTVMKKEMTDVDTAKINDIIFTVTNINNIKIINLG